LSPCLINYPSRREDVWRSEDVAPLFFISGVNFTFLPHYPWRKRPRYPLDRRLGGPHSWSGRYEEGRNIALPGIELLPSSPFFLILDCEAIGTEATPGLLCQPRVIVKMIVERQMECRLAGETEVLGENLPQRHLSITKSHMARPGFEPGPPRWEAGEQPPELWRGLPSSPWPVSIPTDLS
jgi:hypothetical protein